MMLFICDDVDESSNAIIVSPYRCLATICQVFITHHLFYICKTCKQSDLKTYKQETISLWLLINIYYSLLDWNWGDEQKWIYLIYFVVFFCVCNFAIHFIHDFDRVYHKFDLLSLYLHYLSVDLTVLFEIEHMTFFGKIKQKSNRNYSNLNKSTTYTKFHSYFNSFLIYSLKNKISNSLNDEMVCFVALFHFQSIFVHGLEFLVFGFFSALWKEIRISTLYINLKCLRMRSKHNAIQNNISKYLLYFFRLAWNLGRKKEVTWIESTDKIRPYQQYCKQFL